MREVWVFFFSFFWKSVVRKIITSPTSFSHNATNTIQCFFVMDPSQCQIALD